jgi:hypothetical protein
MRQNNADFVKFHEMIPLRIECAGKIKSKKHFFERAGK